jgi:hypothetical protein
MHNMVDRWRHKFFENMVCGTCLCELLVDDAQHSILYIQNTLKFIEKTHYAEGHDIRSIFVNAQNLHQK